LILILISKNNFLANIPFILKLKFKLKFNSYNYCYSNVLKNIRIIKSQPSTTFTLIKCGKKAKRPFCFSCLKNILSKVVLGENILFEVIKRRIEKNANVSFRYFSFCYKNLLRNLLRNKLRNLLRN